MSTLEEHIAGLKSAKENHGWDSKQFAFEAHVFCHAHLEEISEALVTHRYFKHLAPKDAPPTEASQPLDAGARERVARAIYEADDGRNWDGLSSRFKSCFLAMADAAIQAMRNPKHAT